MASVSSARGASERVPTERAEPRLEHVPARPKLGEEVTRKIREAILTGTFADGDKLVLEELAKQLGVSVMPVREALITLESQALVTALPRKGFRARPLSQQDLDDLFELHSHLAGILAGRAALVATSADIANLRAIQQRLVMVSSRPISKATSHRLSEANADFHRFINRLPSGNRIRWFIRQTSQFIPDDLYQAIPGWLDGTLKDHPKIIDALEARDAAKARSLMESHFIQGAEMIGRTFKQSPVRMEPPA